MCVLLGTSCACVCVLVCACVCVRVCVAQAGRACVHLCVCVRVQKRALEHFVNRSAVFLHEPRPGHPALRGPRAFNSNGPQTPKAASVNSAPVQCCQIGTLNQYLGDFGGLQVCARFPCESRCFCGHFMRELAFHSFS